MYHEIKSTPYSSFNKHPEYFTLWESFLTKYNDIQLHGGYRLIEKCIELFTFYDKNENKILNFVEDQNKETAWLEYRQIIREFREFRIDFYKVIPPDPKTRPPEKIEFHPTPEQEIDLKKYAKLKDGKYNFEKGRLRDAYMLIRKWNIISSFDKTDIETCNKIIKNNFLYQGKTPKSDDLYNAKKNIESYYEKFLKDNENK